MTPSARLTSSIVAVLRDVDMLVFLLFYAAAKLVEQYDWEIFEFLGILSGHSIKHVISAAGIGWLVYLIKKKPDFK